MGGKKWKRGGKIFDKGLKKKFPRSFWFQFVIKVSPAGCVTCGEKMFVGVKKKQDKEKES